MNINPNNFIVVQGWMITELNLKGNDLLVYAIIYGFSQTKNQKFTGSLQYLADWCNSTKTGIQKNLKNLLEQELIAKENIVKNGVNFVTYYVTMLPTPIQQSCMGIQQSCMGIQQSCTNNIDNNIDNNKVSKKVFLSKDKNTRATSSQKFVELYHRHCYNLPKIKAVSTKRQKAIDSILKKYSMDEITTVFDLANNSDFLTGNNDRGWKADIDFILREDKFISIAEGKYSGKKKNMGTFTESGARRVPTFNNEDKEKLEKFQEQLRKDGKQVYF